MAGPVRAKPILGYGDPIGAAAGDRVEFKVHCDEPGEYSAALVRIVCGDATPGGAGFEEAPIPAPFTGVHRGGPQRTCIGSRGAVDLRGYANDVCRVTENVLRRFLDASPFGDPPARPEGGRA